MRQAARMLHLSTPGQGLHEITAEVVAWTRNQEMTTGLLTLFCRHTSASLVIQENADPNVRADVQDWVAAVAPESRAYRHQDEGPDDLPAHLRAVLTGVQLSIPLIDRKLALGTWQGIYLFEHRKRPHRREVALHLLGV